MKLDKLKKIFQRHKDEDESLNLQGELDQEVSEGDGDIDLSEDIDPEDRAKTLKKKAIMISGGAVAMCAVFAVVSNTMFSTAKPTQDAPLKTSVSNVNPAAGLPDKYSDIGKYQNDENKSGNSSKDVHSTANNNNGRTSSGSTTTSNSTTNNKAYPSPTNSAGNAMAANDSAAKQAEKERQAVINSAIAFAIDFTQGKTAEATAVQTTSIQPTYRYANEEMPESSGNFELYAGSVIQATLLTGVTSDFPGDVVAQIRQNIYDSLTGQHLLIPQGSKLIGTSGNAGSRGNKRIGVIFKRIILPNGISLDLPDQQAIDGTGYPGLVDKYDDHASKLYRTGFMSALFAAAAQSLTGNTSGDDERSPGQEAVSGAVASILETGQELVARDANVNPTIEIAPGFQFSVFINQDLMIGEYVDY